MATKAIRVLFVLLVLISPLGTVPQALPDAVSVGRTTYEQAASIWSSVGGTVLQRGKLSVGAGSGVDGAGHYAVEQVTLIDVSGIDFEGLRLARYGFVDGVLFSVQARLDTVFRENRAGSNELSEAELQSLEARLRAKYGNPSRSARDLFAGTKPNVLIWDLRDNELILHLVPGVGSSLVLRNKALTRKVEAYRQSECRKHRPQCA
jgi:hypothetical protein